MRSRTSHNSPGTSFRAGAHLGGFVGGYLIARLMNPFNPERTDHLLTGLVLAVASLLAVVWSVLVPIQ